jgi:hypothetical protein
VAASDSPDDGQISLTNSPRVISFVRPSAARNRVRLKTNFLSGFKLIWGVQSCLKIFLSENQKWWYLAHIPPRQEGRLAIVTNARRDAMDAEVPLTSGAEADGEIVWSWRPDAGVKSAIRSAGDGGKRARSPGRARISSKPSRRECRSVFGEPVVTNSCGFLLPTRGCGCAKHPAFPAPSYSRGWSAQQLGRDPRRGIADACLNQRRHCERSEAIQRSRSQRQFWIASSLRSSQ